MYEKFTWTEEYSVNIPEIDTQHKTFINICNHLLDLANTGDTVKREDALVSISRLGDYAFYHLGTEEELFIELDYPNPTSHLEAHYQFREKVKHLISKAIDKDSDIKETLNETAMFAGGWLLHHILVMDKNYSQFFNEHGVQ
jgi:hemerythrin-like metal-binding protein